MIFIFSTLFSKGKHCAQKIHQDQGVKYTFFRFGIVGFFGTLVDFLTLYVLVQFFLLNPIPAKILANELAIINNFTFNNLWTFSKRETLFSIWQRFVAYNLTYLGSFLVSTLMMAVLVGLAGKENYLIYNLFTIPVNVLWNFILSHKVTWKIK